VKRILPTLAWFLASKLSHYQTALLSILREAPDVAVCSISRQVKLLLETPFHCDRQRRPLVLVIDALDECANPEEVQQLSNSLLSVSKDLPVKIFLTSRPERHIVDNFESLQSESHLILRLHDIEQDLVEADISLFLDRQL
jgi:archaellum biogenesis ATPase FlaH